MRLAFRLLGTIAVILGLGGAATAASIDTGLGENSGLGPFGPNVGVLGQTFTVGASQTEIRGFSFFVQSRYAGSGTLDVRGYLASWDGSTASAILYESAVQTITEVGQELAFTPSLSLIEGATYVAFLSISNIPGQSGSEFYIGYTAQDLIQGVLVYQLGYGSYADLTTGTWGAGYLSSRDDLHFTASFADPVSVPAPAALPVFALGLVGLGFARRRPRG